MKKMQFLYAMVAVLFTGCQTIHAPAQRATKGDKMLEGMRIAILVTDGFEQVEMTEPKKALEDAGAEVLIVSPKLHTIQGYHHDKEGDRFDVDISIKNAHQKNFSALLLPGGVKNPDQLRLVPEAIQFIKEFGDHNKPIAAICHGPWPLINAGLARGRKMTSWPSLEADLRNAGAEWVDQEVVVSKNIVTSRKPDDIPAFNQAMIELFAKHHRK